MFRRRSRDPTRGSFGRTLLAIRDSWDRKIATHASLERPNQIALLSGSAGAAVALGGYGTHLIAEFSGRSPLLETSRGDLVNDSVVQFANALQSGEDAIEAAYRVITWAMVSEQGAFYWRPNYELEIFHCAEAFEFRNEYEGEIPAIGEPCGNDASPEARGARKAALIKATLRCMISVALDQPVAEDDMFVAMQLATWHYQFDEALSVVTERTNQLSPEGLPIWDD